MCLYQYKILLNSIKFIDNNSDNLRTISLCKPHAHLQHLKNVKIQKNENSKRSKFLLGEIFVANSVDFIDLRRATGPG